MTKVVEGFSRGENVALPVGGGHEIGVLATAFAEYGRRVARQDRSALLESEQMARDVVADALDAFVQTDEAGAILEWNPAAEAIFGWSRQEVRGKEPARPVAAGSAAAAPQENAGTTAAVNEASAAAGERFEIEAIRKDGHSGQDRSIAEGASPPQRLCRQRLHPGS